MANKQHLDQIKQGVAVWNAWRKNSPHVRPNLRLAELRRINLHGANLVKTNLSYSDLREADLSEADLRGVNLSGANLRDADLSGADLQTSLLAKTNFYRATLREAKLMNADLSSALLVETQLKAANLTGARIYGVAVWNVEMQDTIQEQLIITPSQEPIITVDDLEVAQFVHLLLKNEKLRNVIDTIGQKGVLILGRFTDERKTVLDAIRQKLRDLNFVPMMFDFERPTERDFTETIKTLAGMSRFIIADITNPKSSPLELQATMPDYMIPFVPIIHEDDEPFAMFRDLKQKYGNWVLNVLKYDSAENLLQVFEKAVVRPALKKGQQLLRKKAEAIRVRHVTDYM